MARYPQQHLEIPQLSIAVLAIDTVGCLSITSKWAFTAFCLHMSCVYNSDEGKIC